MTSGSLGQGLAVGLGMALAARQSKRSYEVYVLMSDGEMQEGGDAGRRPWPPGTTG